MIVCSLGPDAPFYRALTPSWAHRPESGAGAALAGGRFNRPNVEARYLAATPEAALAEYQGESLLLPPATVATYQVTAEAVVDFTGGYNAEHWSPIWAEAYGNWKGMAFLGRGRAAVLGDRRSGARGGVFGDSLSVGAQSCVPLSRAVSRSRRSLPGAGL